MNTNDLFPETLLVRVDHGQPMTDSLTVAKFFGKNHQHVLRDIRRYVVRLKARGSILRHENADLHCPDVDSEDRLRNFVQVDYLNERKQRQPMYLLTEKGFFFVAHKFTGPKAEEWQWKFLDAFEAMDGYLRAKEERFAHALDQVRPALRPIVEGTEQGHSRSDIAAPLGKSVNAITYHRSNARRLGLLPPRKRRASA